MNSASIMRPYRSIFRKASTCSRISSAINPFGKVPVLVDGDFIVAESAAISLYLAERYGGGRFLPAPI